MSKAADLMKKLDKEAEAAANLIDPAEHYRLALESVLRWTNRQGYPHEKLRAIRTVAGTALLLAENDDFGTPVPAVMRKVIDRFAPTLEEST